MKKPVFTTMGVLSLGAMLAVVGNHPSLGSLAPSGGMLNACTGSATTDTDGDGLPDLLEWVLGTNPLVGDSDGDGMSDFVEVIIGADPLVPQPPTTRTGEWFRVLPFVARETINGNDYQFLYVNQLYRISTGRVEDVQSLEYFVDVGGAPGLRIQATEVMLGLFDDMQVVSDPQYGALVRLTMKVPLHGLETIPGGTLFGTYTDVNNQRKAGGGVLAFVAGSPTTILPLPNTVNRFVVQPLDPSDVSGSTVWTRHRFCLFDLVVSGSSRGGQLCTIENADCSTAVDRACAPDCRSSNGGIIFIPDGLGILKGG